MQRKLSYRTFRAATLAGLTITLTAVSSLPALGAEAADVVTPTHIESYFTADSGRWNIDPEKDIIENGVLTITEKSGTVRNVNHTVDNSDHFEVEFRAKVNKCTGSGAGFKYEYGERRIIMWFDGRQDIIKIRDSEQRLVELKVQNTKEWHTYKFSVEGTEATLYLDEKLLIRYELNPISKPSKDLNFFVMNGASISIDAFRYEDLSSVVSIVAPLKDAAVVEGQKLRIKAEVKDSSATTVDYYANGVYIGSAGKEDAYTLEWPGIVRGEYNLTAKAGDNCSLPVSVKVAPAVGTLTVIAEQSELAVGQSTTVSLKRVPKNTASVVYYANGVQLPSSADNANTAVFAADVLGKTVITAKVMYADGSYDFAEGAPVYTSATETDGIKLQSSYVAEFTAAEGAKLNASDGIFGLDLSFGADGVTYTAKSGVETYKIGVGDYKVAVDGGSAEVYYNGQYAFSFLMPLTAAENGMTAAGVSNLRLSGINATRYTVSDGVSAVIHSLGREYAAEWVLDGPVPFKLELHDGAYLVELYSTDGQLSAKTYPNGEAGVVEEEDLCTVPDGRHAYRLTVSNGISQLFIDNEWAASIRLPKSFAEPYVKLNGIGTLFVRETEEIYTFADSFDGSGELESSAYWSTYDKDALDIKFADGQMILFAKPQEKLPSIVECGFDDDQTMYKGIGSSVANGIMTVTSADSAKAYTVTYDVPNAENFEYEVRARVASKGKETGFRVEYEKCRVQCYLQGGGIMVLTKVDGKTAYSTYKTDTTKWHTYKFIVTDSKFYELFIDGVSQGRHELADWKGTSEPKFAAFVKADAGKTVALEMDYSRYVINDTEADDGTAARNALASLIKAYSFNPTVSTTVRVDEAPAEGEGGVYIAARYNNKYRNVLAGYNFTSGVWEIVNTSAKAKVLGSVKADFPFGTDVKLELTLNGNSAILYVNGERMTSTGSLSLDFYGQVGIAVEGVAAKVSEFEYAGSGRPVSGAISFDLNEAAHLSVFEYADGHIIAAGAYESTDDGYNWSVMKPRKYSFNTVKLPTGEIVYIDLKDLGDGTAVNYAYVSTDNGATFEGPYQIQTYMRNRITMPDKTTVGSTGRLFFVSGESGDGVEDEGGERVFYSDDKGRTWTAANLILLDGETVVSGDDEARMDIWNTQINFQEGKLIEMPDGTLRIYRRTDEGFLMYCMSEDNGETWTSKMWKTPFISVLSAFNIDRDPYTGDYYIAWEYNNANDDERGQYPRTRVGLAVSRDGMNTWEYVGDMQINKNNSMAFENMNIAIEPTKTAVYVNVVHYPIDEDGTRLTNSYMVRVDKETMKTTSRFTRVYTLNPTKPDSTEEYVIETMLALSPDGSVAYTGGRMFEQTPTKGYVSIDAAAAYIGAAVIENGNSAVLKMASSETVFTAGSSTVTVNGKNITVSEAPVMNPDGLYVSMSVLCELYGRNCVTAENGVIVSAMNKLELKEGVTEEILSGYMALYGNR